MSMPNPKFTNGGKLLHLEALDGAALEFTRIALGDGRLTNQSPAKLTALIHEVVTINITKSKRSSDYLIVGGLFNPATLSGEFWWRELGLYAIGASGVETLYCYANAFEEGEHIQPDAQVLERTLTVGAIVGDAQNVSVAINESLAFATQSDLSDLQLQMEGKEDALSSTAEKLQAEDADGLILMDSTDANKTKRVLWSAIKTTLKTWFDTLYAGVSHSHAWSAITGKPTSFAPSAHAASHRTGGADALTAADVGARPNTWTPTAADVGARPSSWTPSWSEVQSKPTTFTPSAHTHAPADLTSAVPITKGGTGATTAAAARAALAALAAFPPTAITISATWSGTGPWTQSIAVAGVLAAWDWRLGLHLAKITDDAARKLQEKAYGCITWCETYDGGITLTCRDKKPDVAISAVLAGEV